MYIKTIFLDMDGVIVDFHRGVLEMFGVDEVSNPTEWEFKYREDFGMSAKTFWNYCDNDFWRQLEFTPEAVDIFQALQSRDLLDRVCLLSHPVSHAFQGKVDWIKENLPQMYNSKQFLLGPIKHWCAHPESLLIDDCYNNCRDFVRAGGNAFIFPRPWNICRKVEPQAVLELERYLDLIGLRGPNCWMR